MPFIWIFFKEQWKKNTVRIRDNQRHLYKSWFCQGIYSLAHLIVQVLLWADIKKLQFLNLHNSCTVFSCLNNATTKALLSLVKCCKSSYDSQVHMMHMFLKVFLSGRMTSHMIVQSVIKNVNNYCSGEIQIMPNQINNYCLSVFNKLYWFSVQVKPRTPGPNVGWHQPVQ